MPKPLLKVFFHPEQFKHRPLYEWAFGTKMDHPETTNRAERILAAIKKNSSAFSVHRPSPLPQQKIAALHNPALVKLLKTASKLPRGATVYPSVFPRRDQVEANANSIKQAGYYCFDSGTPLTSKAWDAAYWSASAAYSAAKLVRSGKAQISYALSRPPGHHASKNLFGGYCYFNNAAIAATQLKSAGRVAIVDIDFHHGNGTQSLFYKDDRVLFISVHGDPQDYYPFFSGYATEKGIGRGKGFTLNLPVPGGCDGQGYLRILDRKVIPVLKSFAPKSLVLSAGFDTFKEDPIGDFKLETSDFALVASRFAALNLPTVVVQEGGYATRWLGKNVATFLLAMRDEHK